VVLRYNTNGTLDTSFSGDGGVITDVGFGSVDVASCVAVQSDGKIIVGGHTHATGFDTFLLLRYNTNGTLDSTFGTEGRVIFSHLSSTDDQARAIAIQSDGKIVLTGVSHLGGGEYLALARFTKDGSPDTAFSDDGFREYTFNGVEFGTSVAIQKDGKIVAAGYTNLKIQSDGKILIGGHSTLSNDFVLARLNADGTPDLPFGGSNNGRIVNSFGATDIATSLVLQPDGKAILAGYSNADLVTTNNDFALARYNTDGTQDLSFDTDGELLTNFGTDTEDRANAMAFQPDGRIVLVGRSGNDFAAARYNLFGRVDARVGSNNSATTGNNIYNTTGAGQSLDLSIKKDGGKKTSFVRIQNDGHENATITVQGTAGNGDFTVRYLSGSTPVTSAVVGGSFNTGSLASGASIVLKVEVTAKTKKAKKTRSFSIKATGGGTTDTVIVKAKSK
ncbi:MAG: hypothetical protein EOP88_28675, partial [Verrucomicrobiaceae bacterium]